MSDDIDNSESDKLSASDNGMEDSDMELNEDDGGNAIEKTQRKKPKKRGIIYLSTIPPYMNVVKVREIFGEFGKVGRVFLQPNVTSDEHTDGKTRKRKHIAKHFTEGWVEFESKRKAKLVAKNLNNNRIGSRKRSKFYDYIWNIKYLPRFKWVHLTERLAYERAEYSKKMSVEISQAKKEATKFQENIEYSKKYKKNMHNNQSSSKS